VMHRRNVRHMSVMKRQYRQIALTRLSATSNPYSPRRQ
jgi:hypothetical protein